MSDHLTKANMYSGAEVFNLKDTLGFPFSASFFECERRGLMIDWVGLITEARAKGWYDFQIIAAIEDGFSESGAWPTKRAEIISLIKAYCVLVLHPCFTEEKP